MNSPDEKQLVDTIAALEHQAEADLILGQLIGTALAHRQPDPGDQRQYRWLCAEAAARTPQPYGTPRPGTT